jgi:hypothetical protein
LNDSRSNAKFADFPKFTEGTNVKRLLLSLMCLMLASSAVADIAAGTPKFTWTLPTQNVDGSEIPATGTTALKEVRLYCDNVAVPKNVTAVPALTWQAPLGAFTVGNHTCQATAVTQGGAESAKTNSLPFTMPASPPEAPSNVSVQ